MLKLILLPVASYIFFSLPALAQDEKENSIPDPFQVVQVETQVLSPEELCRIIQDKNTEILKDLLSPHDHEWVAYRFRERWLSFDLAHPSDHTRFEFADIDKDNIQELVVYSDDAKYGSGGGTTDYFVTIYKIDSAVRKIFDFEYGGSEEMFGREYNNGANFLHQCMQEVEADYGEILIAPSSSRGSYDHATVKDTSPCRNTIAPGIYTFRNGSILRTGKYTKRKRQ